LKIWVLFLLPSLLFAQNLKISDKRSAQRILDGEFGKVGQTFFCGCDFFRKDINLKSCGFSFEKYFDRQKRVEWVSVVPEELMAQSFPSFKGHQNCKRVKSLPTRSNMRSMGFSTSYYNYTTTPKPFEGIECVRKEEKLFNRMESDLYNLVPENGAINALKGNASLADIEIFAPQFGKCNLKILNNRFTPPTSLKGDVARIFLYMDSSYPRRKIISDREKKLILYWNKVDPVSKEECERALKIQEIQGNANPFVQKFCK
jgi:deoxyribonuclease-1